MPYDGGNTTGFPSPATIYLEAVIDLAEILDLRKPSRYPDGSNMGLIFQNERLVVKSQFGLK
jgi:hypothetical protein